MVVTGGSSGIGAAAVSAFAAAGHRVLLTYLSNPAGAAGLIRAHPAAVAAVWLDQGDWPSVAAAAAGVGAWAGAAGVQVLVNNAALGSGTVGAYAAAWGGGGGGGWAGRTRPWGGVAALLPPRRSPRKVTRASACRWAGLAARRRWQQRWTVTRR